MNTKITEAENKIYKNVVTQFLGGIRISDVEDKIPGASNLKRKTDLDTTVEETENLIPNITNFLVKLQHIISSST